MPVSHWRELFARTIRANNSRQCETGLNRTVCSGITDKKRLRHFRDFRLYLTLTFDLLKSLGPLWNILIFTWSKLGSFWRTVPQTDIPTCVAPPNSTGCKWRQEKNDYEACIHYTYILTSPYKYSYLLTYKCFCKCFSKIVLFKAYCTRMYGCQLWSSSFRFSIHLISCI